METAFKGKRHFLFYLQLNHNRKVTEAPEWGSGVTVTWKQVPAVTTAPPDNIWEHVCFTYMYYFFQILPSGSLERSGRMTQGLRLTLPTRAPWVQIPAWPLVTLGKSCPLFLMYEMVRLTGLL